MFFKILALGQVVKRAVRPPLVILSSPRFNLLPGVIQRQKPVSVKAFITQSSNEALSGSVFNRLARANKTELDAFSAQDCQRHG